MSPPFLEVVLRACTVPPTSVLTLGGLASGDLCCPPLTEPVEELAIDLPQAVVVEKDHPQVHSHKVCSVPLFFFPPT